MAYKYAGDEYRRTERLNRMKKSGLMDDSGKVYTKRAINKKGAVRQGKAYSISAINEAMKRRKNTIQGKR